MELTPLSLIESTIVGEEPFVLLPLNELIADNAEANCEKAADWLLNPPPVLLLLFTLLLGAVIDVADEEVVDELLEEHEELLDGKNELNNGLISIWSTKTGVVDFKCCCCC